MLLLFETPAGFALFTVLQENKLEEAKVGGAPVADFVRRGSKNTLHDVYRCCRTFGATLRLWMMHIRCDTTAFLVLAVSRSADKVGALTQLSIAGSQA